MSTVKRSSTAGSYWTTGFYWVGVTLAVACFALTLGGNTESFWRFEHRGLPLSWTLAGVAVFAFLAAELCHYAFSPSNEAADRASQLAPDSQLALDWEAIES